MEFSKWLEKNGPIYFVVFFIVLILLCCGVFVYDTTYTFPQRAKLTCSSYPEKEFIDSVFYHEGNKYTFFIHGNDNILFNNDLKTLPEDIKEKMFLYHFQDNVMDDWDSWHSRALDDGFGGFLDQGRVDPL